MGKFIVLEGIDGSGKSTTIKQVFDVLDSKGYKVYTTQEPTYSDIGSLLREQLKVQSVSDNTLLHLFLADRFNHCDRIRDFLNNDYIVLCDRYMYSTYAYQNISWKFLDQYHELGDVIEPNLVIYLDISVDLAIDRLQSNRSNFSVMETEKKLIEVYNKYKVLFNNYMNDLNVFQLDVDNISPDLVTARCIKEIEEEIKK